MIKNINIPEGKRSSLKRLISVFMAGPLLICTAVSCGSSGSDDDSVANNSAVSEEKSSSFIVGTWDISPEYYDGMEVYGMKVLSMKYVFRDDETVDKITITDSSNFISLYDNKMVIEDYEYKILNSDRKKLVIGDNYQEVTFVRASESSDKYGEYELPEDFGEGSDSTIHFESPGASKLNFIINEAYRYSESAQELTMNNSDGVWMTRKIDTDGNDKFSYTNSDGTVISCTRAG